MDDPSQPEEIALALRRLDRVERRQTSSVWASIVGEGAGVRPTGVMSKRGTTVSTGRL
jgi:hypothetical protein